MMMMINGASDHEQEGKLVVIIHIAVTNDVKYVSCIYEMGALVMNAPQDISGAWLESLCGPFYLHELTLIPVWMNNYIHYKVWDGITYPFPNVNGAALNVWEWVSTFIPHFTGYVITYPCWN